MTALLRFLLIWFSHWQFIHDEQHREWERVP